MTRENVARAAVEGMLCGLADGRDALRALGVRSERILLIGGGARSAAVRAMAPTILGAAVTVPSPSEYVAIGAARQAAWILTGKPEPPAWPVRTSAILNTVNEKQGDEIRSAYAEARHVVHGI